MIDKSSKMSQDTISSGHNINFDEQNTTNTGTNSATSLTFSQNNSMLNFNNNSNFFYPICKNSGELNSNNLIQNTLFLNKSQINTTKKIQAKSVTQKPTNNRNQDPLSHIYETISVNSVSNLNNNTNNHYNLLNYYHLHQSNQNNNYNDIDCDFDNHMTNVNLNNINYNDSSLTDSSMSHKSHDYFLDNRKNLSQKNSNWTSIRNDNFTINNQHKQQQNNAILFDRNLNRFSDMNLSNTNTSSPSSTTTTSTLTDYITNPNANQFTTSEFQQFSDFNSKCQFQINQHTLPALNSTNNLQMGYSENNNNSAFSKCNNRSNIQLIGRSSFKNLNNAISQHNVSNNTGSSHQQTLHHQNLINSMSNLPIHFLSHQIEAVV